MKAYCINLNSRPARWEWFKSQNIPFSVERFPAIYDEKGSVGCMKSHLTLLLKCEDEILIFEDDCEILQDWSIFDMAYSELPYDWDVLYLGANLHTKLEKESAHLYRLFSGWGTHGIIYRRTAVDKILSYDFNTVAIDRNIDTFIQRRIQTTMNCFIIYPCFATQKAGHSDIVNQWRAYDDLIPNFYKYTDESPENILY